MKYLILLPALFIFATTAFASHLPSPSNYVNDFANVLSQGFEDTQNIKLKEYKEKTTNEIAVVTIDSTGDESIEQYSIHLADQWKPGEEGVDNGVIMLFAIKDRKMRIEVGRGVEDRLTDIEASDIIDEIKPSFRNSNYEEGIGIGITSVIAQLEASPSAQVAATEISPESIKIFLIIFFSLIALLVIGAYIAHKREEKEEDYPSTGTEPDFSGVLTGGALGYGLGRMSSTYTSNDEEEENDSDYSYSSSDDDDDSYSSSSSNSWSSNSSSSSFGGFSGGSFSGGGASGSW